ncbi:MAG: hypothetical protein EON55_20030 [Alphaproteobacteria bacterium]|nr:MAG: hypothetical protein EON55_20030 [Alphaproteobacteria bacterium]
MDRGTVEALKAIITGLATAQADGSDIVAAIGRTLAISSSHSTEAGDHFTASELARLARWVQPMGEQAGADGLREPQRSGIDV